MALNVDFDVLEGPVSQFSPSSYLSINPYFRIAAPFTGTKTETLSFGTLGNDYMSSQCKINADFQIVTLSGTFEFVNVLDFHETRTAISIVIAIYN